MPRFAANLSLMYADLAFLDRFEAAAADGFDAVECQFPYAWTTNEIASRLARSGLELVSINTPASSAAREVVDRGVSRDEQGLAALTGREEDFRAAFDLARAHAEALGCPRIHVMAGLLLDASTRASQRETFVRNLRWAAERVDASGITLLIEPLNLRDNPGYFLHRQDDAHAIVADVGSPRVKVMLDLYHCQIAEGDVATHLRRWIPGGQVGHIQVAGVPERHEPDVGELNYDYLFGVIDALGWSGRVGCEYRPQDGTPGGTSRGLGWLARARPA